MLESAQPPHLTTEPGKLLRVFVAAEDQRDERALYECVIDRMRARGLAAATVHRGVGGYVIVERCRPSGTDHHDEPIIITAVDRAERITAFLPELNELIETGVITISDVDLTVFRHGHA